MADNSGSKWAKIAVVGAATSVAAYMVYRTFLAEREEEGKTHGP